MICRQQRTLPVRPTHLLPLLVGLLHWLLGALRGIFLAASGPSEVSPAWPHRQRCGLRGSSQAWHRSISRVATIGDAVRTTTTRGEAVTSNGKTGPALLMTRFQKSLIKAIV
jgi:hypothetical protein